MVLFLFSPSPWKGEVDCAKRNRVGARLQHLSHRLRLACGADGPRPAPFGRDPPLPGEGEGASPLILATRFFAPELCHGTARKLCLQINKGRRSANRRNGRIRTGTSDERIRVRGQCGERHGWSALPRASARGRPRLSALRRGIFQLRAALPGNLQRLKPLLQTPLLASSSRTGRSAGEAGSEAARVRVTSPRAGTASRSINQYVTG